MGYLTFIVRNLLGRPVRTLLTVLGLAVAVSAVMLLGGISSGFERSFLAIYSSRGIDLIVVRAGISDQLSSNLAQTLEATLRAIPGVREVSPSLMDAVSFEDANLVSVLANGWEPDSLLIGSLRMQSGRSLRPGDGRVVMLGRILALNLGKRVGEPVKVAGESFDVIGIYESDSLFENGGLVMPLPELQRMMGREGQVTGFVIVARPGTDPRSLGKAIEAAVAGVAATPVGDYVQGNIQMRLARSMSWATTAVALALGSIGLLNTMAMAVFERTGEIGLLRALGWRRRRIILLLMGEAAGLGLSGVAVGTLLAYLGARALMLSPTSRGYIEPNLSPGVLAIGLGMGVGLTLLGGLYPAVRASRLEPTEASVMTEPLLEALDLVKTYPDGDVKAVRGVSLTIRRGEFAAITGPSGCGKSTLLHLLGGLDHPDAGEVCYRGTSLADLDLEAFRARELGFVFQSFHLIATLTASENVQVPMFEAAWGRAERARRALHLLETVGLAHRAHHRPRRMSVGERQRVAIARALANEPSLLLADEPTGNLDSATQGEILELLGRLRRERDLTLVVVTHSPEVAAAADRSIRLRDGVVLADAPE